jgi:Ca-activated chloride channel homolog
LEIFVTIEKRRSGKMRRGLLIVLLSSSLAVFFTLSGQDNKPSEKDDVIRVETQLVDVPIAVTTTAGVPLRGLKASNFIIYEDGKPQEIVDFSTTSEPFEVALLLDTSGSTRNDLQLIQRAAADFIASLRPGDRVALIAYSTERKEGAAFASSEILSKLTDDRVTLKTAVERVRTSNGTPYYDSLLQVAEKIFAQRPAGAFRGRRALVALTDGVDSTSAFDFALAREELNDIGVISFFIKVDTREFFEANLLGDCQQAIRFSTEQMRRYYRSIVSKPGERLAISKKLYELADTEMNELARTSGGKVFPVGDLSEARSAFKRVADEIGTKYTLGYYPSNGKKDGSYRKIRVEVKGLPAGTQIRSREGYTALAN